MLLGVPLLKQTGSKSDLSRLVEMLRTVPNLVLNEPDKKFTLAGGKVDEKYIDVKSAYGKPAMVSQIARIFCGEMGGGFTCVAGSGHGGLPIAFAVAERAGLYYCMIRSGEKGHGKGGMIDGYVPNEHDNVLVVDDVLTTGGSLRKARGEVLKTGARISGTFVVVKRADPELDFDVSYLLAADDLEPAPSQTF